MYYCESCGSTFEDPARHTERIDCALPFTESYDVCPECGEPGVTKLCQCDICGRQVDSEILIEKGNAGNGICIDCLKESITYEDAFGYLMENMSELLEPFITEWWWGINCANQGNGHFGDAVVTEFFRQQHRDQEKKTKEFLNCVRDFICDDIDGARDYAKFIEKMGW